MAAIRFFVQDPGHSGLPEILIVAPMNSDILGNPVVAHANFRSSPMQEETESSKLLRDPKCAQMIPPMSSTAMVSCAPRPFQSRQASKYRFHGCGSKSLRMEGA